MCKCACVEKVEHIFAKSWMISRRTQIWSNLVALLPDFINDNTFIHPKKYLYHDKINLIIILKGDRRSSPGQPCLRRGAELKSSTSKTAHRCQKPLHTFRWADKILENKHQRSRRLVVVKKFQAAVLQKQEIEYDVELSLPVENSISQRRGWNCVKDKEESQHISFHTLERKSQGWKIYLLIS